MRHLVTILRSSGPRIVGAYADRSEAMFGAGTTLATLRHDAPDQLAIVEVTDTADHRPAGFRLDDRRWSTLPLGPADSPEVDAILRACDRARTFPCGCYVTAASYPHRGGSRSCKAQHGPDKLSR